MADQQSFCHFLELVSELGMLIIDKMEAADRCRFSGSSKVCNKKAKDSKNYIYGLDIYASTDSHSTINVEHGSSQGFSLFFEGRYDTKVMRCAKWIIGDSRELWRTQLDNSTDPFRIGIENFKIILKNYQDTIKKLIIDVDEPVDFELRSLKNLEDLTVYNDTDIRQFLSKTRKRLTNLVVTGQMNGRFLENHEQMYQVKGRIHSPHTRLNNQKFLQLSASNVSIHIGQLTENDIYNFIRSWQNGTIRNKDVLCCAWNLGDSKFDVKKLFELFGDGSKQEMDFQHKGDATKVAKLDLYRLPSSPLLCFRLLVPEEVRTGVSL